MFSNIVFVWASPNVPKTLAGIVRKTSFNHRTYCSQAASLEKSKNQDESTAPEKSKGQEIPFLNSKSGLPFRNSRPLYETVDLTVNIDNQNTLSSLTYSVMAYANYKPPISREAFIESWKAIILLRLQHISPLKECPSLDLYERPLPAPLADLCNALDVCSCTALGIVYRPVPPVMSKLPNFHTKKFYEFLEDAPYYKQKYVRDSRANNGEQSDGSICMTAIKDKGDLRSVRAVTRDVSDLALIARFMNDDLFAPLPYDDLGIQCVGCAPMSTARLDYVKSYMLPKPKRVEDSTDSSGSSSDSDEDPRVCESCGYVYGSYN